jgi:hypothetical protein
MTNRCLTIVLFTSTFFGTLMPCCSLSFAQTATPSQETPSSEGSDARIELLENELAELQKKLLEQNQRLIEIETDQKEMRREIARLSADKVDKYNRGPIQKLFDGKTLDGWEVTPYGGEGECTVVDNEIHMGEGDPISGINVVDGTELPKNNYEISYSAMKIDGNDFFGSLTFPVNDSHCTLVVGGWGGPVVGLSSIDDQDASENETRTLKKFEKKQWYHIRVRVLPDRISAWFDGEMLIDQPIDGRTINVRNEVISSQPLGISSYRTKSAGKNIELQTIEPKTTNQTTGK